MSLEIPILPDMYGVDPIEFCLSLNLRRVTAEKHIFKTSAANKLVVEASDNLAMASLIFSFIKDYSLMSCSFFINDSILEALKRGVTGIGEYLDSRLIQASHSFTSQKEQYNIKWSLKNIN